MRNKKSTGQKFAFVIRLDQPEVDNRLTEYYETLVNFQGSKETVCELETQKHEGSSRAKLSRENKF